MNDDAKWLPVILIALLATVISLFIVAITAAHGGETRPYSCRLYDDEQRKCAFGSCNQQTLDQLRKDCLVAGGRP